MRSKYVCNSLHIYVPQNQTLVSSISLAPSLTYSHLLPNSYGWISNWTPTSHDNPTTYHTTHTTMVASATIMLLTHTTLPLTDMTLSQTVMAMSLTHMTLSTMIDPLRALSLSESLSLSSRWLRTLDCHFTMSRFAILCRQESYVCAYVSVVRDTMWRQS